MLFTMKLNQDFAHLNMNYALGMIPDWLNNQIFEHLDAKNALDQQYVFGNLYEHKDVTITEDGVWEYPGDPDLNWICKIERGTETIYIYEYALVAIVQEDGSSFSTRMD